MMEQYSIGTSRQQLNVDINKEVESDTDDEPEAPSKKNILWNGNILEEGVS